MESPTLKQHTREDAVKRLAEMLERLIESGEITMEMLEDENFAQKVVDIYIELKRKKDITREDKKRGNINGIS